MKLTQIVFRQHIGRHFKKHWWVQSKITPIQTKAEDILREKGLPVYNPEDILSEEIIHENIKIVGVKPECIKWDTTHPHWHNRVCLILKDEDVLLEGLTQAKIITNTVEVKQGLPQIIHDNISIKGLNTKVKEIILNSHIFDAQQQKLPKIKDPLRPAWNFPRSFGIIDSRRNILITSKLLQLIEVLSEASIVKNRTIFNDLYFVFPFEKNNNLIQFQLRGDTLLTSTEPLKPVCFEDTRSMALPTIDPIEETITLNKEHIYELRNCYPIDLTIKKCHPHTLFIHYNESEVRNIYEEEVTDTQIYGRSLLKAFTVAASYAKQLYGENIKDLPKPITLQCVHTNGRLFQFGVFQLNTLDLVNSSGIKNVWYQTRHLALFEKCSYILGKPTLEGYNNEIIKYLLAFYNSCA